jgi:hypothetical protein
MIADWTVFGGALREAPVLSIASQSAIRNRQSPIINLQSSIINPRAAEVVVALAGLRQAAVRNARATRCFGLRQALSYTHRPVKPATRAHAGDVGEGASVY